MRRYCMAALLPLVLAACHPHQTRGYERLSYAEQPVSTSVGGVTFQLRGVVDQPFRMDLRTNDLSYDTFAAAELSATAKLPNQWRVGAGYLASTEADYSGTRGLRPNRQIFQFNRNGSDDFQDGGYVYVEGTWGRVQLANDQDAAGRVITRRAPGAGNGQIQLDNFYGGLRGTTLGYTGRYSAWTTGITVDDRGYVDAGIKFERPIGQRDYNLALRANNGEFVSDDGTRLYETRGVFAKGEIIYGSTLVDAGFGYELMDSAASPALDRFFISTGLRHKSDQWTWSLEGLAGTVEGDPEFSAAFGASYDLARGTSLNFGLNYTDAHVRDGATFVRQREDVSVITSLRYAF